ncbi:MAG: hypothetical protein QHJ82_13430 [Verrucomicrobiota bacterium]|nr:hypothetical protein [Verrucomicrobiota bacterium]
MKFKVKQWLMAIAVVCVLLFAGGCGGVDATGSVSPLMFIKNGQGGQDTIAFVDGGCFAGDELGRVR